MLTQTSVVAAILLDSLGLIDEIKAAAETSTLADDIALAMTIAKAIASDLCKATRKFQGLLMRSS